MLYGHIGSLYKKIMVVFGQKHTTEANFEKCSSHYSFSTLGAVFFYAAIFHNYVSPKYNKKSSINKVFFFRVPCCGPLAYKTFKVSLSRNIYIFSFQISDS